MKVLHLVKTSVGATWAYRLMRDLAKLGVDVHVALPANGPLVEKYKDAGIIVHDIDYSFKRYIHTSRRLRDIVEQVSPDLIHSHFVLTTLIMRMSLRNVPIKRVFEVPGPLHLEHFIYREADLWSAQKKIDYWIPTCQWSYDKYKSCGISEDRLHLAYYGNDYTEQKYPKGKLREELGLESGDKVVGMVAYMYAPKRYLGERRGLKGHEDLIDAISILDERYSNLHLVFVGGAWNGAIEYEKHVMEYGKSRCRNIYFLGTRSDVAELYQDFDVAVHPSHSENLGGAAESLSLEIPTIATNIGGFPDIVIDGETGFLVPPFCPSAMAIAIEKMLNDPIKAKVMASKGKALAISLLNNKKTSKSVFDFYNKIIG